MYFCEYVVVNFLQTVSKKLSLLILECIRNQKVFIFTGFFLLQNPKFIFIHLVIDYHKNKFVFWNFIFFLKAVWIFCLLFRLTIKKPCMQSVAYSLDFLQSPAMNEQCMFFEQGQNKWA